MSSTPSCSSPRSRPRSGRRPVATSRRSGVEGSPLTPRLGLERRPHSSRWTELRVGLHEDADAVVVRKHSARTRLRPDRARASRCSLDSTRGTTSTPIRAKELRELRRRPGRRPALRGSRGSRASTSPRCSSSSRRPRDPRPAGSPRDPVATTSRSYGSSSPSTSTMPGRTMRASPRTNAHSAPRASRAGPGRPSCSSPSRAMPDAARLRPLGREAGRAVERRGQLGRAEHRLRRHARVVRALTADEPALDERDLRLVVEPAEGADEVLAGRPSARTTTFTYESPFAFRKAAATFAGDCLSMPTALFMARSRQRQLRGDRVHDLGGALPPADASFLRRPVRRSGSRRCASCPSRRVFVPEAADRSRRRRRRHLPWSSSV